MTHFHFASRELLWLALIVIPVVIFQYRHFFSAPIRYSSVKLFDTFPNSRRLYFRWLVPAFRGLTLLAVIGALARPQLINQTTEVTSEGVGILLVLDTSLSMKALDFSLNGKRVDRLTVVKSVVEDFIKKRSNDMIGMVVFGQEAYTQCPLTFDKSIVSSFLENIYIGIAGDGTAIGNALVVAVKRLKDKPIKSKLIILLTDGKNTAGGVSPDTATELAQQYGLKIYSIGVGSHGKVPFPVEGPFGTSIRYEEMELDEDTLKHVSESTGGQYFRASDTEQLEKIYDAIDAQEKTKIETKVYTDIEEYYWLPLIAAVAFFWIEQLLALFVFVRIP